MTLELATQIADDLLIVDGQETVTLLSPAGAVVTVSEHALRRAITTREAETSQGQYRRGDVRWHLPASDLTSAPELGARMRDEAGIEWTVLEVEHATLATRWRLTTRRLALDDALDERVTIQTATTTLGLHGEPHWTWNDMATDMPARVQPRAEEARIEHWGRTWRATHVAYLATAIDLSVPTRLLRGDEVFHVLRVRSAERIDALVEVDLIATPWPTDVQREVAP